MISGQGLCVLNTLNIRPDNPAPPLPHADRLLLNLLPQAAIRCEQPITGLLTNFDNNWSARVLMSRNEEAVCVIISWGLIRRSPAKFLGPDGGFNLWKRFGCRMPVRRSHRTVLAPE